MSSSQRPGGALVDAIVQPSWNTSSVTYRIAGDNSSVHAVLDALVANCSIANSSSSVSAYTPGTSWPLPEQVIQYYRASSFMLSLDGYNNTAALASNAPSSNSSTPPTMADTPLPSGLNTTLLACINATVAASIPLEETPASQGLTTAEKWLIGCAACLGVFLLLCFWVYWLDPRLKGLEERRSAKRKEHEERKRKQKQTEEESAVASLKVVDADGNVVKKPEEAYEKERGRESVSKPLLDSNVSPSSSRSQSPVPSYSPRYPGSPSFEERTLAGDSASTLSRSTTKKWGGSSRSPSPYSSSHSSTRSSIDEKTLTGDGTSMKDKKRYSHVPSDSQSALLTPTEYSPICGNHATGGESSHSPAYANDSVLNVPGQFP